ncbi:MAG: hypothetical protein MJ170_00670 [Alphaproteobacteria bacterium]|nr:hypothetical protein [Alphaproteobacteria bacterium]
MKTLKQILFGIFCAMPFGVMAEPPVATTAGSNLTAFNSNTSLIGNQWAAAMNPRSPVGNGAKVAEADFGNCNALIIRCAQPKCSGTGCADASVATSIVTGCIQANDTCRQYEAQGLTDYVVAQLVANSTAKANAAAAAAQNAAAQAAAQQSAQQLQQMQYQMQQMQNDMANQNAQTIAQLQSALAEQKQIAADAAARAAEAAEKKAAATQAALDTELTVAQQVAAASGIDPDIIVRQQVSGEILTNVENAETQLKALKATMYQEGGQSIFTYAGCDATGSNCTGPKRVKRFKELANGFFDPYNAVLDEMYDALMTAQTVGVDVTDIYMMLNDSCNQWGQYLCSQRAKFTITETKDKEGISVTRTPVEVKEEEKPVYSYYDAGNCKNGKSVKDGPAKGGHECTIGMVIPPEDDMYCVLQKTLSEKDGEIQRQWLYAEQGDLGDNVRVGCASSALNSVALFRNRNKKSSLDVETLQNLINQDAPANCYRKDSGLECKNWCYDENAKTKLFGYTTSKNLDADICLTDEPTSDAKKGTKCQEGESVTPYVIPALALCSTHVYNIGQTTNGIDSSQRADMSEVIALKTTVITQQLYKQYEYLESIVKRLKTQLKKAVLTTKAEVASGVSSSSSSQSSSGSASNIDRRNGIFLSDARNCGEEIGVTDIIACLRSNYNIMNSKYKDSSMSSDLKKQLKTDHEILKGIFGMIIVPETYAKACTYGGNNKCLNTSMSSSDVKTCLSDLSTNLTKAQTCYEKSQQQFQSR